MPKVNVNIPHSQDPAQVAEKIKPALEKTLTDFQAQDLQINWAETSADFQFKSLAFTIKGNVDITADQVAVEVELPFAAMMFKDKVQKALSKNIARVLEA